MTISGAQGRSLIRQSSRAQVRAQRWGRVRPDPWWGSVHVLKACVCVCLRETGFVALPECFTGKYGVQLFASHRCCDMVQQSANGGEARTRSYNLRTQSSLTPVVPVCRVQGADSNSRLRKRAHRERDDGSTCAQARGLHHRRRDRRGDGRQVVQLDAHFRSRWQLACRLPQGALRDFYINIHAYMHKNTYKHVHAYTHTNRYTKPLGQILCLHRLCPVRWVGGPQKEEITDT